MEKITLQESLEMMTSINQNPDFNCFFEGKGDGRVGMVVEEKLITIMENENECRTF